MTDDTINRISIDCASDGEQLFVEADSSIALALHNGDHVIFEGQLVRARGAEFLEHAILVGYWGVQR